MRPHPSLLIAACALALAPATALASEVIDTGKASGDFAIATASGTIENPGTLKVKVTATPGQKVSVNWIVACSQPDGGAGSKDGEFTARAPVTRTMRKPATHVTSCTLSASASLSNGGRLKVTLTG
jgi:hypothetical protein